MEDSLFFRRQSKRSYLDKPIPEDVLDRVLEKTRWSPSCANKQPWRFVLVSDPGQHAQFVEALARGNEWAARAPVLAAVCAREADDVTRDDDPVQYYQFDCGLAVMGLLLAATDEGLMGHPMAGYDAAKLHEALDIPADYHVICVVSLGYQGPIDLLEGRPREYDEAPRVRKDLSEIVCWDRFEFK